MLSQTLGAWVFALVCFLGCSEVGMGEREMSRKKGRKLPVRNRHATKPERSAVRRLRKSEEV
jgi:hypothetical protein